MMVCGRTGWFLVSAIVLAIAGAVSTSAAEQRSGVVECGQQASGKGQDRTEAPGCGAKTIEAKALLSWLMSLPQDGHAGSTGPGGATIAGNGGLTPPPSLAPAPPANPDQARPNEVLVVLQPGAAASTAQELARDYALRLETFTPSLSIRTAIVRLRIPDARTIAAVLTSLTADPRVRASQPNFLYRLTGAGEHAAAGIAQYALGVIHAEEALARLSVGAPTPLVAVIDTGIDEHHPDLTGIVRDRFDAVGDGHWDIGAHGTGIAGIIAAHGQLQGVDPLASVLSVRAFPATDSAGPPEATSLALVRGIDWALAAHADVINMSLAGPPDPLVDASVEEAMKAGAIVVSAAGNGGPDAPPAYPAAIHGVVAVTATDARAALFKGSNLGAYISLAAPGVDVLSDVPGGGVSMATGTSQAAAHVSGVLAILRTLRPSLKPTMALDVLRRTARTLDASGRREQPNVGEVDAAAAAQELSKLASDQ